jgi:uncharacterized protein (TIGR00159 family)
VQSPNLLAYWRELTDIIVATLLIWGSLLWLKRSRAFFAFLGLAILSAVYLVARRLHLDLTAWIFQGFSAVVLILIVVVFQEDLRRLLERIGAWGAGHRVRGPASDTANVLVHAVARLAETRAGAILVLPGNEPLDRHLEGGIPLGGRVSEPLLLSLFDHHSPGHDGAVVLEGAEVSRFGVHLPLSTDSAQLGDKGTRHAAALGLAERTDALCVIVSEERGTVSVARDGVLTVLGSPKELGAVLAEFTAAMALGTEPATARWRSAVRHWPYLLLSFGLSVTLWFVLILGSTVVESSLDIPVTVENLPAGYQVESVEPAEVTVSLSGPRRALYFRAPGQMSVKIDALLAQLGRRTFQVSPDDVQHPPNVAVLSVFPNTVRISLRRPENGQATQ